MSARARTTRRTGQLSLASASASWLAVFLTAAAACSSDDVPAGAADAGSEENANRRDAGDVGPESPDASEAGPTAVVSPELTVGPTESSLATSGQWLWASVTSAKESLVCWVDGRAESALYAAHIAAGGDVLEPAGVRLPIAPTGGLAVAASDKGYLLVWGADPHGDCDTGSIQAAFLPVGAGNTLGAAVTLEQDGTDCLDTPTVVYDGGQFVAIWNRWTPLTGNYGDGGGPPDLHERTHLMRFDSVGKPLDAAPNTLAGVHAGAVAGSSQELLLAWRSSTDLQVARIHTQATPSADPPVGLGTNTLTMPALAYGQETYLLVWIDVSSMELRGTRVGLNGAVLDAEPLLVGTQVSRMGLDFHNAWVDGSFRVSWAAFTAADGYHTRTVVVGADGVVQPEEIAAPETKQLQWTWNGSEARAFGTTGAPIRRIVQATGALPLTPEPIIKTVNGQRELSLTSDGSDALVAWADARDDDRRVMIEKRSGPDAAAEAWRTTVGTVSGGFFPVAPSVAARQDQMLVAWLDSDAQAYTTDVRAVRLSASGAVLDVAPILLGTDTATGTSEGTFPYESVLAAAAGPADYLVAYQVYWANADYHPTVCAVGISDAGESVSRGCTAGLRPAVARVGSDYGVMWSAWDGQAFRVYGSWLAPGETLGPAVYLMSEPGGFDSAFDARMTSDGATALVTWEQRTSDANQAAPYGALVNRAGFVKTAFRVAADEHVDGLTAAFDGQNFRLVWHDGLDPSLLRTAVLRPSGELVGEAATVIEVSPFTSTPAVTALGPGRLLLGYDRLDDALGNQRARLRMLSFSD